jgi:hypothetical protein
VIESIPVRSDLGRSHRPTTRPDVGGGAAAQRTPDERRQLAALKQRDAEVRRHEQAHAAAGGAHTGAPHYHFEQGPDGQLYAVGGEVAVDASPVRGDLHATILKMQQVVRAALAPADPSGQDQQVAAAAAAVMARARVELALEGAHPAEGAERSEAESSAAAPGSSSERSSRSAGPTTLSHELRAYRAALQTPETPSVNLVACVDCGHAHWR